VATITATIFWSGIGIITLFSKLQNAIPATWERTRIRTGVFVHLVSVIALFRSLPNAIPATGGDANIGTGIGIDLIAIIALFPCLQNAVPATGGGTGVGTCIIIDLITIVALFRQLHQTVAATRTKAGVGTSVIVHLIAVIALLRQLCDAISTARAHERICLCRGARSRNSHLKAHRRLSTGECCRNPITRNDGFFFSGINAKRAAVQHAVRPGPARTAPTRRTLIHKRVWYTRHNSRRT